jgi:hypothetical protein
VRRARAAGPLTVAFKARRALRAHRPLKVTAKVAFAPAGGGPVVRARRSVVLR